MSQVVIKTHYSAAELAVMRLPGIPTSKGKALAKAEREGWAYVRTKGIGGTRREYAPPPDVMESIKGHLVQQLLTGEKHDQAVSIESKNSQGSRTLGAKGMHGENSGREISHSESRLAGSENKQRIYGKFALLPGAHQPTQPVQHSIALTSQKRIHGTVEFVPAESGALRVQATALKDWQKRTAEARMAILREVDRVAQVVGREKAIQKVSIMAQDGTLPEHLAQLVPIANARSGRDGKRSLSRRTLYDWFAICKANSEAGSTRAVNALAPKDQHAVTKIPVWAADLLAQFQRPQKPSLRWAVEQIYQRYGIDEECLYHQARRFIEKMGNVESMAGRMGARDIKNVKPFVRRDSSMLWPADVYTADGHAFDAEVAHPAHGRPFRPEITTVRDTATRKVVGWSIDLAESGLAVLDAIRHACETGGICSIFYVDNGSGYKNAMMSQPGIGMESRLGFTMTHSIAYNSQARGIVEKGHRDIWVRAAKELPTYMGKDMDAEAKNKVFKITRKDIKTSGVSKYLMPWQRFLEFVKDHAERYNNRPHRSLKMIYDAELGRKRHMTPNESWIEGVEAGAQLVTITPEQSLELFRPMKEVKVLRGEVRLFNNLYFSNELTEYHGDIVRVAYDIHNADSVWVYDEKGRFVCSAGFEANKRDYFPETFLDQAARKRSEGRLSRLDVKREEVLEELQGAPKRDIYEAPAALENIPSPTLNLVGEFEALTLAAPINEQPNEASEARPLFPVDSEHYEWLMQRRGNWNEADKRFLRGYIDDPQDYAQLADRFELLDISWGAAEEAELSGEEIFKVAV
jgi:putative transposase